MRICYRGNFQPDLPPGVEAWSTESEIERAFIANGHEVIRCQEDRESWLEASAKARDADVFVWTSTHDFAQRWNRHDALTALDLIGSWCPTVQWHADLWWGLDREHRVREEPMFRCQVVLTPDGGHDDRWVDAGVNHAWMPPAAPRRDVEASGTPRPQYAADVAFIGSWTSYHAEHRHRFDLVQHLQHRGAAFWPRRHEPAVRGPALRDLVASVKVHVGDSCFAGRVDRYWSDRVPYLVGMGGFLLHPYVPGIEDHFVDGEHLVLWEAGNWGHLDRLLARYVEDEPERRRIAEAGREHVLAHHTFDVRVRQVVALLAERGMLRTEAAA